MLEILRQNPSVVIYILGGIGAIAAMVIGAILIRRGRLDKTTTSDTTSKTKTKTTNK